MRHVSLRFLAGSLIALLSLPLSAASDRWYNSETGQVTERALGLYAAIALADQHGLESDDLKVRLQQTQTVNDVDKAHNEVLDSLIRRFSVGQVPTSIDPLWHYPEKLLDLDAVRRSVLAAPARPASILGYSISSCLSSWIKSRDSSSIHLRRNRRTTWLRVRSSRLALFSAASRNSSGMRIESLTSFFLLICSP